jgi:SPX domain protein involved in polyphosphate accumulation
MIRQFHRLETKYLVSRATCERIMRDLAHCMHPDPHGGRAGYAVVSLYYDSPNLSSFWAKLDRVVPRRRLRLRIYPEPNIAATALGMVEIKERASGSVSKRRLALPLAQCEALCSGALDAGQAAALAPPDRAVADEVSALVHAQRLRPTAITAFHRIAFVGLASEPDLRITFDADVRGRIHGLRVAREAANHPIVGSPWCVMEVKASEGVPSWVTALLDGHGCQVQRMSKYRAVVSRLSGGALPPWLVTGRLGGEGAGA